MSRADGRGRLPELLAAAAVAVPGLLTTVLFAVVVGLLAAAVGSPDLVGTLLAVVLGFGLVGTVLFAGIAWLAVGRTRTAVRERVGDARFRWFRRARSLEAVLPVSGLSAALEPDEEVVVERLRRRYVAGDLDERAFERELERLLGDAEPFRTGGEFRDGDERPTAVGRGRSEYRPGRTNDAEGASDADR